MSKYKVKISDDIELVTLIKEGLKKTGGYCPCKIKRIEDNICPCKDFREAVENNKIGKCHCGLYEIIVEEGDKNGCNTEQN